MNQLAQAMGTELQRAVAAAGAAAAHLGGVLDAVAFSHGSATLRT